MTVLDLPRTWGRKLVTAITSINDRVEALESAPGGGGGAPSTPTSVAYDITAVPGAFYTGTFRDYDYVEAPIDLSVADVIVLEIHGGDAELFLMVDGPQPVGTKTRLIVTSDDDHLGIVYLYDNYDDWNDLGDIQDFTGWRVGKYTAPLVLDIEWIDPAAYPAFSGMDRKAGLLITRVGKPLTGDGMGGRYLQYDNDTNDTAHWADLPGPDYGGIIVGPTDLWDRFITPGGINCVIVALSGYKCFIPSTKAHSLGPPTWTVEYYPESDYSNRLSGPANEFWATVDTAHGPLVFAEVDDVSDFAGHGYDLTQQVPINWTDEPDTQPTQFVLHGLLLGNLNFSPVPRQWAVSISKILEA